MSHAVVVVEAGVKGGALITAAAALEQGVAVFAVPGDVMRDSSKGTNLLIRDGAHPVMDSADLVEALSLVVGPPRLPTAMAASDETDGGLDSPVLDTALLGDGADVDEIARRGGFSPGEALAAVGLWVAAGVAEWEGARVIPRR